MRDQLHVTERRLAFFYAMVKGLSHIFVKFLCERPFFLLQRCFYTPQTYNEADH